jgi:hypothetical protein
MIADRIHVSEVRSTETAGRIARLAPTIRCLGAIALVAVALRLAFTIISTATAAS